VPNLAFLFCYIFCVRIYFFCVLNTITLLFGWPKAMEGLEHGIADHRLDVRAREVCAQGAQCVQVHVCREIHVLAIEAEDVREVGLKTK
jgi:hypothetical protein